MRTHQPQTDKADRTLTPAQRATDTTTLENHSPQAAQLRATQADLQADTPAPIQKMENKTGMPDHLKGNLESMSGFDMSDVRVHYNSDKPAQLQAHAYAQGTDIHIAPGQERHLPHEAWHVVQQKQGRVKPTMQLKGVGVNDDVGLEKEADVMGDKVKKKLIKNDRDYSQEYTYRNNVIQRIEYYDILPDIRKRIMTTVYDNITTQFINTDQLTRLNAVREAIQEYEAQVLINRNLPPRTNVIIDSITIYAARQLRIQGAALPVGNGRITSHVINGQRWTFYKAANRTIEFTSVQEQKNTFTGDGGILYQNEIPVPIANRDVNNPHQVQYPNQNQNQYFYQLSELNTNHDINIGQQGRRLDVNRATHFRWCNDQIGVQNTPANMTWHHHLNYGRMQLIDRDVHGAFNHYGGHAVWGGG